MAVDDDLARRLANAIEELARAKKNFEQEKTLAVEWEKKAMLAIKAGNDDLAKQALARKIEHEKLAVAGEAEQRSKTSEVEALRKVLEAKGATASTLPVAVPAFINEDDVEKVISGHDDLKTRFRMLHRLDVDGELTSLKEKMGILPRREGWIH